MSMDAFAELGAGLADVWGMNGLEPALGDLPVIGKPRAGQARLRVTTEPIYDAERTGTSAITDLRLFVNPEGGLFTNANTTKKTYADTNLKQQGQLGSPLIFDLTGFNLKLSPAALAAAAPFLLELEYYRFYIVSWFEFLFNNRPFLQVPTIEIPHGVAHEGFGTTTGTFTVHNGVGLRSNMFKFMVGKFRVRIRSTENFSARVVWSSGPTFATDMKAHVLLQGYKYNGI